MVESIELLKKLLATIGINDPTIEIESEEAPDDMLIVDYYEFIFFNEEAWVTGHIDHDYGSLWEPPSDDYINRETFQKFHQAAKALVLHLAGLKIDEALVIDLE